MNSNSFTVCLNIHNSMLSPHAPNLAHQNLTTMSLDCLSHHSRCYLKYSDRSRSAPNQACKSHDSSSSGVTITSGSKHSSALNYQNYHLPTHGPLSNQVAKLRKLPWPDSASWTSLVLHQSTEHEPSSNKAAKLVDLARLVKIGFE